MTKRFIYTIIDEYSHLLFFVRGVGTRERDGRYQSDGDDDDDDGDNEEIDAVELDDE